MKSRMKEQYRREVVPALMKRFDMTNPMAVPKLTKIVVNIGLGEASQNVKLLDVAVVELGQIAGQKAVVTRAKKSIANFKIRKGMPIGCCVTLRGDRMYEFLDRLCNVVLPRVRDFKGLPPNAFDGRGNYTLGLARPVGVSGNRLHARGQNQGHEHYVDHHGAGTTKKAASCCAGWVCRSAHIG